MHMRSHPFVLLGLAVLAWTSPAVAQNDLATARQELDTMFERPEGTLISEAQKKKLADFLARCHGFEDELFALVRDRRGSISAEHGIGLLKRDHLHYSRSAEEIAIMRGIKAVIDPAGIFNPGKIFPPAE